MSDIKKARVENLPVNYEEELAKDKAVIKERIGALGGTYVRINRDKTFGLPGDQTTPTLTGVIVEFAALNQYYKGRFDPKNLQGPVCVASGQIIHKLVPFERSPEKQAESCDACPMNQWGSEGRGKACKNQRQLALVAPDAQGDGPIMLLKISPTGVKFFDNFVAESMNVTGALIKQVTEISFDPKVDYPSLRFKIAGINDNWQEAFGRRAMARELLLAEPEFATAA